MKNIDLNRKWLQLFKHHDEYMNPRSLSFMEDSGKLSKLYGMEDVYELERLESIRNVTITTDLFHYEDLPIYNRPFPFKKC